MWLNVTLNLDSFFISIIILDISFILLPQAAFFLQQREKKIKCSKKSRRRSFTVGLYFWCVCCFQKRFTVKRNIYKNVRSRFLNFHLLLENGCWWNQQHTKNVESNFVEMRFCVCLVRCFISISKERK